MFSKVSWVLFFLLTSSLNAVDHSSLTPKAGGGVVFGGLPGKGGPLTAAEVLAPNSGWAIDPTGMCDIKNGCQYKNSITGETRFLPLAEKKILEAKTKVEVAAEPAVPVTPPKGIVELPTREDFDKQFKTDQKVLHFVFSAVDCGGCKLLKGQLDTMTPKETPIFTLTRKTYKNFEGHSAHEAFREFVGAVPVMFRYTQQADGTWQTEKFMGAAIFNTLKQLK